MPRCYPRGLGVELLRLYDEAKDKPRLDLRQKRFVNPKRTDLQIFRSLPLVDPLVDAQIPGLFLYLIRNPKLIIPDGWQPAMEEMRSYMESFVSRLQCIDVTYLN